MADMGEYRRRARTRLAAAACREFGGLEAVTADLELQRCAAERFAELLDFFGLNVVPEGRPGVCRRAGCDEALPMSAATVSGRGLHAHWRRGYCSVVCSAEAPDG